MKRTTEYILVQYQYPVITKHFFSKIYSSSYFKFIWIGISILSNFLFTAKIDNIVEIILHITRNGTEKLEFFRESSFYRVIILRIKMTPGHHSMGVIIFCFLRRWVAHTIKHAFKFWGIVWQRTQLSDEFTMSWEMISQLIVIIIIINF